MLTIEIERGDISNRIACRMLLRHACGRLGEEDVAAEGEPLYALATIGHV